MQHLTGILVYHKDLPDVFIEILKEQLSNKIDIQVESDKQLFKAKIEDSNLYIIDCEFLDLLDDNLLKVVVVTKNIDYDIKNKNTAVVFDPFKNEDRSKKDYKTAERTFLKTVEHSLKLFGIPTSPDDSVQTILALD